MKIHSETLKDHKTEELSYHVQVSLPGVAQFIPVYELRNQMTALNEADELEKALPNCSVRVIEKYTFTREVQRLIYV